MPIAEVETRQQSNTARPAEPVAAVGLHGVGNRQGGPGPGRRARRPRSRRPSPPRRRSPASRAHGGSGRMEPAAVWRCRSRSPDRFARAALINAAVARTWVDRAVVTATWGESPQEMWYSPWAGSDPQAQVGEQDQANGKENRNCTSVASRDPGSPCPIRPRCRRWARPGTRRGRANDQDRMPKFRRAADTALSATLRRRCSGQQDRQQAQRRQEGADAVNRLPDVVLVVHRPNDRAAPREDAADAEREAEYYRGPAIRPGRLGAAIPG